jgi:hypothetical protein
MACRTVIVAAAAVAAAASTLRIAYAKYSLLIDVAHVRYRHHDSVTFCLVVRAHCQVVSDSALAMKSYASCAVLAILAVAVPYYFLFESTVL